MESRPVDDDTDPLDTLLSSGLGACIGRSRDFGGAGNETFFFGGLVMRKGLLVERFVSLQTQQRVVWPRE